MASANTVPSIAMRPSVPHHIRLPVPNAKLGSSDTSNAAGPAPHSTAQGVKIDPTNSTVVATAPQNGHGLGDGKRVRDSGTASSTEVTSTSRLSTDNPDTC